MKFDLLNKTHYTYLMSKYIFVKRRHLQNQYEQNIPLDVFQT